MPPKAISHLLRARNLRVIVILLILLTIAISLIILYTVFNSSEGVVPTPHSQRNGDNNDDLEESHDYHQVYSSDGHPSSESRKGISRNGTRGNIRFKGRRGRKKQQFLNRTSSVFSGKCEQIQGYVPDIDANKIYPTLPFEVRSEIRNPNKSTMNKVLTCLFFI